MSHRYVRIDDQIFELQADTGAKVIFLTCSSIGAAKRWVREQEKKAPGSVRVEPGRRTPPITPANAKTYRDFVRAEAKATGRSNQRMRSTADLTAPTRMGPYVQPNINTTSYLRDRQRQPERSRARRGSSGGSGSR